jgi:hypothetical protein
MFYLILLSAPSSISTKSMKHATLANRLWAHNDLEKNYNYSPELADIEEILNLNKYWNFDM